MIPRCHVEDETGVVSDHPSYDAALRAARERWPGVEVEQHDEHTYLLWLRRCPPERDDCVAQLVEHEHEAL